MGVLWPPVGALSALAGALVPQQGADPGAGGTGAFPSCPAPGYAELGVGTWCGDLCGGHGSG